MVNVIDATINILNWILIVTILISFVGFVVAVILDMNTITRGKMNKKQNRRIKISFLDRIIFLISYKNYRKACGENLSWRECWKVAMGNGWQKI